MKNFEHITATEAAKKAKDSIENHFSINWCYENIHKEIAKGRLQCKVSVTPEEMETTVQYLGEKGFKVERGSSRYSILYISWDTPVFQEEEEEDSYF